jgi:DNA-binding NarL/FixJ family response regulator
MCGVRLGSGGLQTSVVNDLDIATMFDSTLACLHCQRVAAAREDNVMGRNPVKQRLTPREREIAVLLANGLKPVIIARRLGMSESSVRAQIQRAQWRLDLPDRETFVAWVQARRDPAGPDGRFRRLRVG